MTPLRARGLFTIRLNSTRPTDDRAQNTAAQRPTHMPLRRTRSHPPSQLHTLATWSREY